MSESMPPSSFTRYCGNYVISDLEQHRLSVARISAFNDPFELYFRPGKRLTRSAGRKTVRSRMRREGFWAMAASYFPGHTRKQLKRLVRGKMGQMISRHIEKQDALVEFQRSHSWETMEQYVRLMCFTEPKENDPAEVPMWGYYGAKHEGVRIHIAKGFCEQVGSLIRVQYESEPPELDLSLDPEGKDFYEFTGRVIRAKSCAWSHENEWRLMILIERCFKGSDANGLRRDFIKVSPEHIFRIDLGIRFDRNLLARADGLRTKFPQMEIYETERHSHAYYPVYSKRV